LWQKEGCHSAAFSDPLSKQQEISLKLALAGRLANTTFTHIFAFSLEG